MQSKMAHLYQLGRIGVAAFAVAGAVQLSSAVAETADLASIRPAESLEGKSYRVMLHSLIAGQGVAIEWKDDLLAEEIVPQLHPGDRQATLKAVLSKLNFIAVYSSATPERKITRLMVLGRGSPDQLSISAAAETLVGAKNRFKDLTEDEINSIAVEASQYLTRIEATVGWQANSNLAHVNQMNRMAVADGSYEAGFLYPNESAGFPPLFRQPRIGDPNRDIAIAQALTQRMAQRGLAALSIALETAEASKPPR